MSHPDATTIVPKHGRGLLRRLPKGVSGNPGGRPAGLASLVKKRYGHDGKELLNAMHVYCFGTKKERLALFHVTEQPSMRDIGLMLKEIADRGHGRTFVPEDDIPFIPTGSGGPTLIFNIPRPPGELEGRVQVVGALEESTETFK